MCGDNPRVVSLLTRIAESLHVSWQGGERELVVGIGSQPPASPVRRAPASTDVRIARQAKPRGMSRTTFEAHAHDVTSWRRDRLVAAGFPRPAAARLSTDPRYDVHALTDLVACGCPPELAARILAPLERREVV